MRFRMSLLTMSLLPLIASCSIMGPMRAPSPIVVTPQIVVPSECGVHPVDPMAVDPAVLPELPATAAPTYLAVRTQRAEIAAVKAIEQRDAERDARMTNAVPQAICASWARTQP